MMISNSIKKYIRISLAGFMSVWLSGVVFLFCCQGTAAAAVDSDHCPMAKMSSNCDKAKQQNSKADFVESTVPACVDCCAFLPAVFDKTRKVEPAQEQMAPTAKVAAILFDPPTITVAAFVSQTFQQPAKLAAKIYIQNCVFRN